MNLTFEFIDALNNDRPASIFMSAENVIYAETRKIYENTLIEYYDMVFNFKESSSINLSRLMKNLMRIRCHLKRSK